MNCFLRKKPVLNILKPLIGMEKPISPFDKTSKVYKLGNGKYRCKNTGKNFTVKTGTIFEKTN